MNKKLRHILGFAAVLGLGVWVAVAVAATRVTVYTPDGKRNRVMLENAKQDMDATYVVQGDEKQVAGPSLRSLLKRAGVGHGAWRSVEVGSAHMTRAEYDKYKSTTKPAFNLANGKFVIPDRGDEDGQVVAGPHTVGTYTVDRGVVVSPGQKTIKAGGSVSFTAETFGDIGGNLSYVWTLEGQDRKTVRQPTYEFPKRGTYDVGVTVRGDGKDSAEGTALVTVDPKKSDDDDTGDDDGDGTPPPGGTTDPGGVTPSYTPPATDPDYPTPDTDTDFPTTPDTPPTTTPDPSAEAPGFSGVSVTGELMSAVTPIPGGGEEEDPFELPELSVGTPQQVEDPELTVSGAALVVGGILGLVGIGAGREFERLHPRRWLRRRRWMKRPSLSALRRLLPR